MLYPSFIVYSYDNICINAMYNYYYKYCSSFKNFLYIKSVNGNSLHCLASFKKSGLEFTLFCNEILGITSVGTMRKKFINSRKFFFYCSCPHLNCIYFDIPLFIETVVSFIFLDSLIFCILDSVYCFLTLSQIKVPNGCTIRKYFMLLSLLA